ncbi:MAG: hypothetical protein QXZ70_00440 [Candidatus Bathyarchaeia archaeon]
MSEKTKIFDRLPKDTGVTFEGFEDIRIKGREEVREQLEDFLKYCKGARGTALRVIIGEWGEGKTDAYVRYIRKKCEEEGNLAFFVSASNLSISFNIPNVQRILETTTLPAVRFLTVLFYSIKQEQKEKLIPSLEKHENAEEYLETIFENLIDQKKPRKIIVFIDEFEELLLHIEKLKQIISGIKETINGQYKQIDECGKFEGCLHLVIAATPDAFYRLQVSEDTALIFGGLGRRLNLIDLPQVRKEEGIKFQFSLLNYSYNNSLPKPLALKNLGIFNAIFRITQGNPGNMVSLFTRLMNSAALDKDNMKVIDYEHFLNFLEKQQIFVYGGASPCLEQETFHRIIKTLEDQKIKALGKNCTTLLKLLTGELKPFSTHEFNNRMHWSEKDVKNFTNIINTDLKDRENIERTIVKLAPLKKDRSFEDVIQAFKEYVTTEKEKKWIRIENYSESLEDFKDRITFLDFEDGEVTTKIFLPSERFSISSFFEGVSHDTAVELANVVCRKLCTDEDYYLVSDEFLSQVYPTPIPRELEFIRNRDVKWKLWREVRKDLAEQYKRYMPIALTETLASSKLFTVDHIKKLDINASFNKVTVDEWSIDLLFYAINGDVKSADIEEISQFIKQTKPPIHCTVLLFTGEITQDAQEKIVNKDMGKEGENVLLDIHIHPTLARRLICMYRACEDYPKDVDTSLLSSVVRKLVTQDIDFGGKIKNWLSSQEEKGVVIKDLVVDATSNLREFAGALKFYINFIEKKATPEEIFEKNRQELLDKFIKYGSKIGLIPDIELPKFKSLSKDLMINRFLARDENKYEVQLHPVEKRILNILEKETKLSEKEIEDFFIFRSTKFLRDVFIPILDYKGLIRKEADYYLLNDTKSLWSTVDFEYQKFRRLVAGRKELWDYGYILIWKKHKEYRFITLKEFVSYIDTLHQDIENLLYDADQTRGLQKLSLLRSLLKHFTEDLLPILNGATEHAKEILSGTESAYSEFKDQLEDIKDKCMKWLKLEFKTESIEEYGELNKLFSLITGTASYKYEEVEKLVEALKEEEKEKFLFDYPPEKAFYFNAKIYKIEQFKSKFDDLIRKSGLATKEISNLFNELDEKLSSVETNTKAIAPEAKYQISNEILKVLKALLKDILPKMEPMPLENITLRQINERMNESKPQIISTLENLGQSIDLLEETIRQEKDFLTTLSHSQEFLKHIKWVYDTNDFKKYVNNFDTQLSESKRLYIQLKNKIVLENAEMLLKQTSDAQEEIMKLDESLKKTETEANNAWRDYLTEVENFVDDLENFLALVTKKKIKISQKTVQERLGKLKEITNIKLAKELSFRLSEIEELKDETRKDFYKAIEPVLAETEVKVLQLIMNKAKAERMPWLSNTELRQIVKKELKIEPKKLDQIVAKLIREGFLKPGISLTF